MASWMIKANMINMARWMIKANRTNMARWIIKQIAGQTWQDRQSKQIAGQTQYFSLQNKHRHYYLFTNITHVLA